MISTLLFTACSGFVQRTPSLQWFNNFDSPNAEVFMRSEPTPLLPKKSSTLFPAALKATDCIQRSHANLYVQ